jgi:hypothetical protein
VDEDQPHDAGEGTGGKLHERQGSRDGVRRGGAAELLMPKVADSAPPSRPMSATMGTSPLRGTDRPVDEGQAKLWICSTVVGCAGAPEAVNDGWKQSGMVFGQRIPTAHTTSTSTVSTSCAG